eukprot:6058591-Pleurochrysis_carterae.AAC.3
MASCRSTAGSRVVDNEAVSENRASDADTTPILYVQPAQNCGSEPEIVRDAAGCVTHTAPPGERVGRASSPVEMQSLGKP